MSEEINRSDGKNALILTTVSGFLLRFEKDNVLLLQRMGYTIHYAANMYEQFYCFDPKELEELQVVCHHIDIARSPFMVSWQYRAMKELKRIVVQNNIQLIHCHTPMGGVLGRLLSASFADRKIPVIYTAHGFHFYKGAPLINNTVYYMVERFLSRFTDILMVINREDYENAKKFRLKKGGICRQMPGVGLDLDIFHAVLPTKRSESRRIRGFDENDFVMISVGDLSENKNHYVVLKAMKLLQEQGRLPDNLRYCICGEGFLRQKLEQWVHDAGLDGRVILYGYCNPIIEYFRMADVMIFPSKREGLGMAAVEALAMGIPVIAADNRGTREYMHPGENGLVCKWNDVEGFAQSIMQIYHMPEQELVRMRENCRESVLRFDRKHSIQIMQEIYAEADRKVLGE